MIPVRWTSVVATLMFATTAAIWLGGTWAGLTDTTDPLPASSAVWGLSFLAFAALGWILAVKLPTNPLGWLYAAFPLLVGMSVMFQEIAASWAERWSAAAVAVTFMFFLFVFGVALWLVFGPGLLLFPDGRLPGKRFAVALWIPPVVMTAVGIVSVLSASRVCLESSDAEGGACLSWVDNPLAVIGVDLSAVTDALVYTAASLALVASFVGLVVRYRRSRGDERQQIKWVVWAVALGVVVAVVSTTVDDWLGVDVNEWVAVASFLFLTVAIPASMAVAIFKYRLYDIDRIINRTVVYAVMVGLLGAVFVVGAVWLPSLLPVGNSNVAVAASTLAVFFLFNPLRVRVQRFVDRRFYRSRYDAQQVADAFSTRLRDQVDPEVVAAEWADVVQRTLQPAAVSVWVKEGT